MRKGKEEWAQMGGKEWNREKMRKGKDEWAQMGGKINGKHEKWRKTGG